MTSIILSCIFMMLSNNTIDIKNFESPAKSEKARLVDIELTVKNIRTNKGRLLIGIFKDNTSFEQEKPYKSVVPSKESLSNGTLTVKVQLEPGVYGASLVDDENNNSKMDYSFVGIPKEGFGFSNYYHTGFSKPKLQSFLFEVKESNPRKVEMVIRYLL